MTDRQPPTQPSQHKEAFCLMEYHCTKCANVELVWNSRDGVTPFTIDCPKCGEMAQHDNWHKDQFKPGHELDMQIGERYFLDLKKEKLIEYKKKMIDEHWEDSEYPMKDNFKTKEEALEILTKDFMLGEPDVEVWTEEDYKTYHPDNNLATVKKLLEENNGVLLNIFEEYTRNHPDVSEDEVLKACRAELLERMSIFNEDRNDACSSFSAEDIIEFRKRLATISYCPHCFEEIDPYEDVCGHCESGTAGGGKVIPLTIIDRIIKYLPKKSAGPKPEVEQEE